MIDAVGDAVFPTGNDDEVSVFSISTGKLDLDVKLVHQPTDISTLGPDYARMNTMVNGNFFYDKILLSKAHHSPPLKTLHYEKLSIHKPPQTQDSKQTHNELTF